MAMPLLKTKLYVPAIRSRLVQRPRLIERLSESMHSGCRLVLVSAPAGFGKTTLLTNWIRQMDHPVAWLSLDRDDNDPARFWSYVIAALQTVQPGTGQAGLAALASPQGLHLESVLIGLINEIAGTDVEWVLVLDDWHLITEPEINDSLVFLLDHLPPQMHLILATRADPPWPLARLRTRGEMTELRTEDLRFRPDEVATFLNAVTGLDLSAHHVDLLDRRTEGWIAGLQLAALSMAGREDADGFLRAFSGSHRFVLDYLVEEVLARQPDDVQAFLLQTSILERLNASLCDAVLGSEGIDSQAVLAYLEQNNLFLVPLDDERRWYRYHRLFADLLRSRLEQALANRLPELYRQASEWCERGGLVDEAISYALAGCHFERAADLVLHYGVAMIRRGTMLPQHRWLASMPKDVIRSRPGLCLRYAWTWLFHSLETAEQWAEATEQALAAQAAETDGDVASDPIWLELSSLRANIAHLRGDGPQAILDLVQQVRERLPQGQELSHSFVMRLAEAYRDLGEDKAADRAYVQAERLAVTNGHHSAALQAACGRVFIARRYGRLPQAIEICRQALQRIAEPVDRSGSQLPAAGLAHILIGRILLEWNEIEVAERTLTRGVALSEPLRGHVIHWMGRVALARAVLAQGNTNVLPELDDMLEQPWPAYENYVTALRAWITWMRASRAPGGLASVPEWTQAVQWADGQPLQLAFQDIYIRPRFLQIRLLITQYREIGKLRLEPILDYIKTQFEYLQERGWTELMIDASIVQAMALQALGAQDQAVVVLERALKLAKPGRWMRIFVDEGPPMAALLREVATKGIEQDYVGRLLVALDVDEQKRQRARTRILHTVDKSSPMLVESLSERELEVLRLLPTHLSSTEIAQELYVSKNTVRSHIAHIYDKLGVHNRTDAVQRAQELGLL